MEPQLSIGWNSTCLSGDYVIDQVYLRTYSYVVIVHVPVINGVRAGKINQPPQW